MSLSLFCSLLTPHTWRGSGTREPLDLLHEREQPESDSSAPPPETLGAVSLSCREKQQHKEENKEQSPWELRGTDTLDRPATG